MTQHSDADEARTVASVSSQALYHWATVLLPKQMQTTIGPQSIRNYDFGPIGLSELNFIPFCPIPVFEPRVSIS